MNLKAIHSRENSLWQLQLKGFILNFIALFFVYGALVQWHFSPDTFSNYVGQYDQIYWQISLGRFVHGIIYHILLLSGVGIIANMKAYTLIFMLVSAWCAMRTADMLCRATQKRDENTFFLCNLAALISMINICVIEWYLFPEAMVMYALALIGATEGALVFADTKASLLKKALVSFVWLFIGINSYQALLGWYGALALISILAQHDFYLNRRAFSAGVVALASGGLNSVLNQIIVKFAQMTGVIESSSRSVFFSPQRLLFNAETLYNNQKDFLKNGFRMLPDYFLFGTLAAGIILLFFAFDKNRIRRMLSAGVALGTGYLLTLMPHLLSEYIWVTFRTLPAVFLILSLIIIAAILCGKRRIRMLCGMLCVFALLVCSHSVSIIITDHMTTIHTDVAEGRAILHEIEKHEKETGTQIEEICFLRDADMRHNYPGVTTMWMDTNPRHLTVEWEREAFMELLSERDFVLVSLSEQESEAIVKGRNWHYPDYDEQIIFDQNRAYIILY